MFKEHFQRLQDDLSQRYSIFDLGPWICDNTYIDGKRFNFKHHEYQNDIISDNSSTVLVNKAAQTGLSEIFARWALAVCCTQRNFTAIWTFPSASDAINFSKARLTPIIASSKAIQAKLSKTVDSVDLKQFGVDTFLYTRGTISETAGLSVPADILIHDELDRSDVGNVSAYVSRLQHKPTKVRRLFSTPTVAGYGIDLECKTAKRKRQVWACSHCNHSFLPSYENDVVIPGWDKPKREINRYNLKDIRWQEAKLLCPSCGRVPASDVKYREWVVENNMDAYSTTAYYVSPFCAPAVITPSYLVKASTDFNKWSEFCNQALGLTAEDSAEVLTAADVEAARVPGDLYSSDMHFLGADMGITCWITIGRFVDGKFLVVERQRCSYTEFESKRRELCAKWRVISSVHDAFPYTDIITRVVGADPNAYGALYVSRASSELYTVKQQEAEPEEGKLNIRAVQINRDVALDELMWEIKAGRLLLGNVDTEYMQHLLDMKRVQKFDKHGGIVYKWEKTQGIDHWHHSLLYAFIAARLRSGVAYVSPGVVPLVSKFRLVQGGAET